MILEALFPRLRATAAPDDDFWYTNPYTVSSSGAVVTPEGSLQVSAVLACVRVLAETLAHVPLHLYETQERGRRKATDNPLYTVLHTAPNDWQTSFEFREMLMGHLCLRGNAYARKVPGPGGAVTQLVPLHPDRMKVEQLPNGRILYTYVLDTLKKATFSQEQLLHIRWFSQDGIQGMSPITVARNAVGLASKSEEYGATFFKNVGRPGGVLKLPPGQRIKDDKNYQRLKASWRNAHSGANMHSVAILEDGMEWQQVGLTNEDAQWIESRKFQTTEIARIYRVPPHMIADLEKATFSNIENQDIGFVKHTMLPWFRRWEDALQRDVIDDPAYFARFALDGLLRGDSASRSTFYREMFNIGVLSINDIRELEEMDAVEGGDTHFVPLNMVPLDRVQEQFDKQLQQPAAPPNDMEDDAEDDTPEEPQPDGASEDRSSQEQQPVADQDEQINREVAAAWIDDAAKRIAVAGIRALGRRVGHAKDDRTRFDKWMDETFTAQHAETIRIMLANLHDAYFPDRDQNTTANWLAAVTITTMKDADDPAALVEVWKESWPTTIANLLKGYLYDEP